MKFGIITLVSENYGNKFQNYAVERILLKYGKVTTYSLGELNQNTDESLEDKEYKYTLSHIKKVIRARLMYQYDYVVSDRNLISSIWYVWTHKNRILKLKARRKEKFSRFEGEYLHVSPEKLNFQNVESGKWIGEHDCFICGSDQIWNPTYSTTSRLAFCSFAPERTIAWAPSFGIADIPKGRKEEFAHHLNNIGYISVREEAGARVIKELTGREAEVLLDPTMTLEVEEWKSITRKPDAELPEQYIVCYFLGQIDKQYKRQIDEFSRKVDMPIVRLFDVTDERYYSLDPCEVLYTIEHAGYVLTDSFHGTVFSILFHRDFYVFKRNEGGMSMQSRLDTLLSKFQFENRYYGTIQEDVSIQHWKDVERVLDEERKNSERYIKDSMMKIGLDID